MPEQDEASVGQLAVRTVQQLNDLVRSHVELFVIEIKDAAKRAGLGAGMFAGAAVLGILAIIILSIAAGYGLVAAGLGPAVSFVIVGGAYLVIAAVLALIGLVSVKKAGRGPKVAVAASKKSVETVKAAVAHDDREPAELPRA